MIKTISGRRKTISEQLSEARLAHQCSEGVLSMAVARLGGMVEGNPTGRHNFLQRIDELVKTEAAFKRARKDRKS